MPGKLASNEPVGIKLPNDVYAVEEALIPISQIPREVRGGLSNRKRYITADSVLRSRGVIREGVSLKESINFNKLRQQRKMRAIKTKKKTEN